jgi:hypothetical protein
MTTPHYDFRGITVTGASVRTIVHAVRSFSVLVDTLHEVMKVDTRDASGARAIDPNVWYPLADYMVAYKKIDTLLGGRGLEKVGSLVPQNVVFPANISDVHGVLASCDIAFHLNHARDGKVMFDQASGMLEGIGHYHYHPSAGRSEGRMVAANPYPCRFDLGLLRGMAQRFAPEATVVHDAQQGCRLKGAESCTYHVSW